MSFVPGRYVDYDYEGYHISVILTGEAVKRIVGRKAPAPIVRFLLEQGISDALDMLIAMPGTMSISGVLSATKSQVHVVYELERSKHNSHRLTFTATTVYKGRFILREPWKEYPFSFKLNPSVKVVFERDYDPALMDAVMDDLYDQVGTLLADTGYKVSNDYFGYVAEVQADGIVIPDARWRRDMYVFEIGV